MRSFGNDENLGSPANYFLEVHLALILMKSEIRSGETPNRNT